MVECVATPLQNRHLKCRFSLREKAALLPKALPLRKQKGFAPLGAKGQMRRRIYIQTRSGIARRRGGKSYERFSAPAGLASQTESRLPSFSSTPAGRSSFSFAERKRRGGCKKTSPGCNPGKNSRGVGEKPSPWEKIKEKGRGPCLWRFKGIGVTGKGGNRNPPFPVRVFGHFLHEQKATGGSGTRSPRMHRPCEWAKKPAPEGAKSVPRVQPGKKSNIGGSET